MASVTERRVESCPPPRGAERHESGLGTGSVTEGEVREERGWISGVDLEGWGVWAELEGWGAGAALESERAAGVVLEGREAAAARNLLARDLRTAPTCRSSHYSWPRTRPSSAR